ncbi:MAG: phosphotransferase family protein [Acidimicrobiales bacterium]
MTTPTRGIKIQPVTEWFEAHIDGAVAPFDFELITGGHSNLTYKVTDAGGATFVLRRPPLGSVLATAHDMAREHRIIAAVAKTAVPIPRALGLCEDVTVNDAPFYVMNHVAGVVLNNSAVAAEAMPEAATRTATAMSVVETLARLHQVDPDGIGLGDLGRKDAYLDRQLKRWAGQWDKSKTRELESMERAHTKLAEAKPPQRYTGIVHGDYRLGNMLVDPLSGQLAAVLDWELCTLGDVLADVGYLLNNWVQPDDSTPPGSSSNPTAAGGFGSREDLVERYATLTGFEVSSVNYYRAFQCWRLAAIVEGVLARYLHGAMGDDGVDTAIFKAQVETLAAQALELLDTLG